MRIGIVSALIDELRPLLKELDADGVHTLSEGVIHRLSLKAQRLCFTASGVGKVNAAMTAQRLIDTEKVELIVNLGVAAGVHPDLNVGDIVVSAAFVQHDFDGTPLASAPGEIPLRLRLNGSGQVKFQRVLQLPAHKSTIRAILASARRCQLTPVSGHPPSVVEGIIASGDQFIKDQAKVRWLWEQFGASCVEMEGAAIAQVCLRNSVGCVGVRAISDKGGNTAASDFINNFRLACQNLATLITAFLAQPVITKSRR